MVAASALANVICRLIDGGIDLLLRYVLNTLGKSVTELKEASIGGISHLASRRGPHRVGVDAHGFIIAKMSAENAFKRGTNRRR